MSPRWVPVAVHNRTQCTLEGLEAPRGQATAPGPHSTHPGRHRAAPGPPNLFGVCQAPAASPWRRARVRRGQAEMGASQDAGVYSTSGAGGLGGGTTVRGKGAAPGAAGSPGALSGHMAHPGSWAARGTSVAPGRDMTQTGTLAGAGSSANTAPASLSHCPCSASNCRRLSLGCHLPHVPPAARPEPHSPAPGGASAGPRFPRSASVSSWAWPLQGSRPSQPALAPGLEDHELPTSQPT